MTDPSERPHDERPHDERIHQLVHDVLQSLHVIGMGAEVLKDARADDAVFDRICAAMKKEQRAAVKTLETFLHAACDGCDSNA